MKSQRMGFKLEMKNCIQNVKDRQPTPFANFICMQENRKFINDNMDSIIANRLIHEFIRRQDATFFNKWQVFPTIDHSFHALCMGIEVR